MTCWQSERSMIFLTDTELQKVCIRPAVSMGWTRPLRWPNPISAVCALPIWSILMPCGDTGEIRSDTERKSRGLTKKLGELLPLLKKEDLLMITADHGNDPTYKGTDHTREQVPLLLYSPSDQGSGPLPTQDTFAVIGATIADNFGVQMPANTIGTSLLPLL